MLMYATAYGRTDTIIEPALKVASGEKKNPLLHHIIKPASALCLAFPSDALPSKPSPPSCCPAKDRKTPPWLFNSPSQLTRHPVLHDQLITANYLLIASYLIIVKVKDLLHHQGRKDSTVAVQFSFPANPSPSTT